MKHTESSTLINESTHMTTALYLYNSMMMMMTVNVYIKNSPGNSPGEAELTASRVEEHKCP